MIRYISHSSATHEDLKKFHHVNRLGKLIKIVGYRFQSQRTFRGGTFSWTGEVVKVIGENGYARFDALLWGYSGEGPRGLVELLIRCGLSLGQARHIAHQVPRGNELGIDWEYSFTEGLNFRSGGKNYYHHLFI